MDVISPVEAVRDCPGCGRRVGRVVWREGGYRYLRCLRCAQVYANLSTEHYELAQHNVWDDADVSPETRAFYGDARTRVHDDFLARQSPFGGRRLLDVGCGLGYFLARASEDGWDVRGCDTSREWAAHANRRLGEANVVCGGPDHRALQDERFDLITAWDVIEHVFDPLPFLVKIRRLLAPGGRVFLRTPNFAYLLPVYSLRRWFLRHEVELGPTNHVVYFTAATMRRALDHAGLEPVDWRPLVPPQIAVSATAERRFGRERSIVVRAKNLYARASGAVVTVSGGRLVISSDLDVLAAGSTGAAG